MVRKRGWKQTDNDLDIELPTKRRCLRQPRKSSSRIRKNLQGKIQDKNTIGRFKDKNKQPADVQAFKEDKSRTSLLISQPPRRSKRLREKVSGYMLDGISLQNESSLCLAKKKEKKYSGGKIYSKGLLKESPPTIFELIAAEEDEIKSHYYKEVKVSIKGFGLKNDGV